MGKFIIIEGPDFCGKSSQLDLLKTNIWYFDKKIFFTREPGSYLPESSLVCEKIREQILCNDNTLEEEAMLFAESRYHHTKEIVELLKADDAVVISDRYIVSSLAYQGYAQYLGKDYIYELNMPSIQLLRDNNIKIHCIKFNIDEEVWRERRQQRLEKQSADGIEQKNIHESVLFFFSDERVFDMYTSDLGMHVYNINANESIMSVYIDFLDTIKKIINN